MKIIKTDLPGVLVVEPQLFGDERGWFMETFNSAKFRELGLPSDFLQDNHSRSRRGVVRGLHYQLHEPQGKLVRCTSGAVLDVAVDIRRSSPHFGRHVAVELSAANRRMLWIPPMFAHAFAALETDSDVLYKCTTLWHGASDRSIVWNDPDIGIAWPFETPELSPKDAAGMRLRDAEVFA